MWYPMIPMFQRNLNLEKKPSVRWRRHIYVAAQWTHQAFNKLWNGWERRCLLLDVLMFSWIPVFTKKTSSMLRFGWTNLIFCWCLLLKSATFLSWDARQYPETILNHQLHWLGEAESAGSKPLEKVVLQPYVYICLWDLVVVQSDYI